MGQEIAKSDIDFQRVQKWYDDTDKEITDVEKLLDEFDHELKNIDRTDTFTEIISKIGDDMETAYNGLKKAFTEAMAQTKTMLDKWKKGVSEAGQAMKKFVEGFHL